MPLNLTWVTFSATKGGVHPGQVKRHNLPFQVEAALKYLVVPLTFAHDCTYSLWTGSLVWVTGFLFVATFDRNHQFFILTLWVVGCHSCWNTWLPCHCYGQIPEAATMLRTQHAYIIHGQKAIRKSCRLKRALWAIEHSYKSLTPIGPRSLSLNVNVCQWLVMNRRKLISMVRRTNIPAEWFACEPTDWERIEGRQPYVRQFSRSFNWICDFVTHYGYRCDSH